MSNRLPPVTIGDLFGSWEQETRMAQQQAQVARTPARPGMTSSTVRAAQVQLASAWVGINSLPLLQSVRARQQQRQALATLAAHGASALPYDGLSGAQRSAILAAHHLAPPARGRRQRDDDGDDAPDAAGFDGI